MRYAAQRWAEGFEHTKEVVMRSLKHLAVIAAVLFAAASCGKKEKSAGGSAGQKTARAPAGKPDCKAWCAKAKACKNELMAVFLKQMPEQARAAAKAEMEKQFADEAKCIKDCAQEQKQKSKLGTAMLACYRDDCKAMAECIGKQVDKMKAEAQKAAQKAAQAAQNAAGAAKAGAEAAQAAQNAAEAAKAGAKAAARAGAEAAKAGAAAAKAGAEAAKAGAKAARAAGEAARKAGK